MLWNHFRNPAVPVGLVALGWAMTHNSIGTWPTFGCICLCGGAIWFFLIILANISKEIYWKSFVRFIDENINELSRVKPDRNNRPQIDGLYSNFCQTIKEE